MPFAHRARTHLAAILTVALGVTLLSATGPRAEAADTTAPLLTSLTRTSAATVASPGTVTYAYEATEDSATLSGIFVGYRDSSGRVSYIDLGQGLSPAGTIEAALTGGLPNESLTATSAWVFDAAGNYAHYYRDRPPYCSYCSTPPPDLDLTALDLVVGGSTEDQAVPILSSITVPTTTVAVGEVARATFTLAEEHPAGRLPRSSTYARFANGGGASFHVSLSELPDGSLSGTVPTTVPNGTYRLQFFHTRDAVGNQARYEADGSVTRTPSGATGPSTHNFAFADLTITVTGSTVDATPPTFTTLTYPQQYLPAGGSGTISYQASDNRAVTALDVDYTAGNVSMSPEGWTLHALPSAATPGTATGPVPEVSAGTWNATSVTVYDQAGNWSRYDSSGRVLCNVPCPATHTVDLAAMAATVVAPPETASAWASPRAQAARVQWDHFPSDALAPVTGYTVTVSPGGKTYTASATARSLVIGDLANDVRHTFYVRARNAVGTSAAVRTTAIPRKAIRLAGVNDTNDDGRRDVVGVSRSATAYLYRGSGTGTITYPGLTVSSGQWGIRSVLGHSLTAPGGASEPIWAVTYDGNLRMYWTVDGGRWRLAWSHAASGLGSFRHVIAPGDFTGDGLPDLLTVSDGGYLYIQTGRRSGATPFWSRKRINGGWGSFTHITGAGDVNGDRRNDLLARKSDGTLWLYPGNGRGGFGTAKRVGSGWNIYHSFSGVGDFNRDGRADLLAVTPGGTLYLYKGTGTGGFTTRSHLGTGFSTFL